MFEEAARSAFVCAALLTWSSTDVKQMLLESPELTEEDSAAGMKMVLRSFA